MTDDTDVTTLPPAATESRQQSHRATISRRSKAWAWLVTVPGAVTRHLERAVERTPSPDMIGMWLRERPLTPATPGDGPR